MKISYISRPYSTDGLFALSIRLVVGWTYFSAFWRRLVLENKLIPDEPGYIGEKFNHFLPNALGIKPLIEYLVTHPEALWWAMVIFTIVEGFVGLFMILGLFTRLMSVGVFALAMGILLGSGWLGTTCLDEWQIGILGIASGFTLFLSGSSIYSLDNFFVQKDFPFTRSRWFPWLGSGSLPVKDLKPFVLWGSAFIFLMTLFTNQYFHGGVVGTLHNKSIKPLIEIKDVSLLNNSLQFEVYRTEGVDVYGSFLIGIKLSDVTGKTVFEMNGEDLARLSPAQISNKYVTKIKPGKHSLVIPLGAKGVINLDLKNDGISDNATYLLTLTDISGAEWKEKVN
ncbi:TQO small subunit DoxD [Dyadobacter sp. CY312]|uniref:TQO small subunit DoxD n=1 Tax=Dyadobacter sp. CY312 TaxID=2907303 RepID=UPI001F180AFC|nr:TQO small subunit DoxD [Dyadobacter sp. CY312]MCE7039873.1 quinol oxidase [Dyadobacter sp. CY312]